MTYKNVINSLGKKKRKSRAERELGGAMHTAVLEGSGHEVSYEQRFEGEEVAVPETAKKA